MNRWEGMEEESYLGSLLVLLLAYCLEEREIYSLTYDIKPSLHQSLHFPSFFAVNRRPLVSKLIPGDVSKPSILGRVRLIIHACQCAGRVSIES